MRWYALSFVNNQRWALKLSFTALCVFSQASLTVSQASLALPLAHSQNCRFEHLKGGCSLSSSTGRGSAVERLEQNTTRVNSASRNRVMFNDHEVQRRQRLCLYISPVARTPTKGLD